MQAVGSGRCVLVEQVCIHTVLFVFICSFVHSFPLISMNMSIGRVITDGENRGIWKETCPSATKIIPYWTKVKVKCTLVQALRLCTGRTAHRGSRGIALPSIDHSTRRR
jgi:hypothetical protein